MENGFQTYTITFNWTNLNNKYTRYTITIRGFSGECPLYINYFFILLYIRPIYSYSHL